VWFTPRMTVTYRPRPDVRSLARQYFDYGRWRREIVRRHPETLSARYLAAPLAVLGVAIGTAAGLLAVRGPGWLAIGWLAPLGYLALVVGGSVVVGRGLPWRSRLLLPLVLATMHGSWGTGFLTSPRGLAAASGQARSDAT
jgi:succinoglycan biosynthesis protein ExoA